MIDHIKNITNYTIISLRNSNEAFLAPDIGYTFIASEYLNIFFQSPRTKTVHQQEKNLNREIYNFA